MSCLRSEGRALVAYLWGCVLVFIGAQSIILSVDARTYAVGPNQALASISEVPWERLLAGDRVLIHWRQEPYREKWVVCSRGTRELPVVLSGVPSEKGELPVVDGRGAVTRKQLDFWNQNRGVIKVGGASHAPGMLPSHIVIENLDVRSARPAYSFSGSSQEMSAYRRDAAAIYVESGENITIRNCRLSDAGNGLFVNGSSILVEHCSIQNNGIENSFTEHNVYSAADGITFQFNSFGRLRASCIGNNLKDRSAGIVVRHNWFEGGSRQLDLVDAEDHDGRLVEREGYRETFVYGNVFEEGAHDSRGEIIHYGGDGENRRWYRRGVLYFYHNTVISHRADLTTLFWLSSNEEKAEVRNNIFFASDPRGRLALSRDLGTFQLENNWLSRGWVKTSRFLFLGELVARGTVTGSSPGFASWESSDYRIRPDFQTSRKSSPLQANLTQLHPVLFSPSSKRDWESRDRRFPTVIGAVFH